MPRTLFLFDNLIIIQLSDFYDGVRRWWLWEEMLWHRFDITTLCIPKILGKQFFTRAIKCVSPDSQLLLLWFNLNWKMFFFLKDDLGEANVARGFSYKPVVSNEVK